MWYSSCISVGDDNTIGCSSIIDAFTVRVVGWSMQLERDREREYGGDVYINGDNYKNVIVCECECVLYDVYFYATTLMRHREYS